MRHSKLSALISFEYLRKWFPPTELNNHWSLFYSFKIRNDKLMYSHLLCIYLFFIQVEHNFFISFTIHSVFSKTHFKFIFVNCDIFFHENYMWWPIEQWAPIEITLSCSNIEDMARDAGSFDVEKEILDGMSLISNFHLWFFIFISLIHEFISGRFKRA